MPADLLTSLASVLGPGFRIVDELGGGGMSRVFTADDLALDRTVVVKVLHPDLAAGVNAERFKREVLLAARLQHPHIVPVLVAGEVDGLPYYVMPFVKGQSLRLRLAGGPMAIEDVIHIMRDVARALSCAHGEGVVHRDIKPDNILLSAGSASVADFGIAKALSSSRRGDDSGLTSAGTSLGTPAYMAPEQVAGDPSLDHRADIYALGCVAYEALVGESPFAGKAPQQMLAAHVLERAAPIGARRADVPPALDRLVMHCMEKDPAQRPQSGEQLIALLNGVGSGTAAQPSWTRRRRGAWAGGALLALAAIVGVSLVAGRRSTPSASGVSVAVAPFEILDPQLALWKEGLVDVLSRNLDGVGPLRTVAPGGAIRAWDGRVGRSDAIQFAKRTGAQVVLYGQLQSAGRGLVEATVWVLDTRGPSSPTEVRLRDSTERMDRLIDSLSVRLLGAIGVGKSLGSARSLGSGSLPAVKAFLTGTQHFRRSQFDSAAMAFRQAISVDSTFAVAYAYLNLSLGWSNGSHAERVRSASLGQRFLGASLSPLDSLTVAAIALYSDTTGSIRANERAAFAASQAAAERYPTDALAWFLAGDFRFHSDPTLTDGEALGYFKRALAADSGFTPAYFHAIELMHRYGATAAAPYIDAYLRRSPRGLEQDAIRLTVALTAPKGTTDPAVQRSIGMSGDVVPLVAYTTLARLPDSAEAAIHVLRDKMAGLSPQSSSVAEYDRALTDALASRGHVTEAWVRARASKSYLAGELAVLGLVPVDSAKALAGWIAATLDGPTSAALPGLLFARDTATLARAFTAATRAEAGHRLPSPRERARSQYLAAAIHAYAQLARGDSAAAGREFDALPDTLIVLPVDQFLRARLIARVDPTRALALFQRRVSTGDIMAVARNLEIGRLAEQLGNRALAVDAFTYVAQAWQNSESPKLRASVREAMNALGRLDRDGRIRATLAHGPP